MSVPRVTRLLDSARACLCTISVKLRTKNPKVCQRIRRFGTDRRPNTYPEADACTAYP
jgi:hypothetical protein